MIGILAAITIVAFGGVRDRANNAKITSAVRGYVVALKAYRTENGAYPAMTSCLGVGYQGDICHADAGWYSVNNGGFNTVLSTYMQSVPNMNGLPRSAISGKWVAGAFYTVNNTSYNPVGSAIAFAQYGVSNCPPVGGMRELATSASAFTDGSGVWCRFALD